MGFNHCGRSYGQCNISAPCGKDDLFRDHTTSVSNLKRKMTSQINDVIYQNDPQKFEELNYLTRKWHASDVEKVMASQRKSARNVIFLLQNGVRQYST